MKFAFKKIISYNIRILNYDKNSGRFDMKEYNKIELKEYKKAELDIIDIAEEILTASGQTMAPETTPHVSDVKPAPSNSIDLFNPFFL